MLHRFDDDPFRRQLQLLRAGARHDVGPAAATNLAENYVGLPFGHLYEGDRMTITSDNWDAFASPPPGTHPPLDLPDYRSTGVRHPDATARAPRPGEGRPHRADRPGVRRGRGARRPTATSPSARAARPSAAHHRHRAAARRRPVDRSRRHSWRSGRPTPPGRYRHRNDHWPGTLDPNFTGGGRVPHRADGSYRFITIRPGAYPWAQPPERLAARPHPLLGLRPLVHPAPVTQMYFPDDPLFFQDPILTRSPTRPPGSGWSPATTTTSPQPEWALGFRFDIVVRGPAGTPFEAAAPMADRRRAHAVADRRAVPAPRPGRPGGPLRRGRRRRRRVRHRAASSSTAPATRPRRRRRDVADRRPLRALPDRRRREMVDPHGEAAAGADAATARRRRRTSSCRCSRAACSTGW